MFQSKEVNILPISGEFWKFNPSDISQKITKETKNSSLIFRFSQSHLGVGYKNLFIPCVPAHSLTLLETANWNSINDPNSYFGVKVLSEDYPNKNLQRAFSSGRRSAIIEQNSDLIRLKGCGLDSEGFSFSKGVSLSPESQEIRGSHYFHTALRELFMTNKVNKILETNKFEAGNVPLGIFKFSEEGLKNLNIQNQFPQIEKFCAVFETKSDLRLFTHLIQGIDVVNSFFIEFCQQKSCLEELEPLLNFLPNDRKKDLLENPQNFEVLATPCNIFEDRNLENYFKTEDKLPLLELKKFSGKSGAKDFFPFLKEKICSFIAEKKFPSQHIQHQNKVFEKISSFNSNISYFDMLASVLSRLGFEMGRIKRLFLDSKINWGCYRDHHPFVQHNNAHPNNFILLPETSKNLLSPIDFDLSFDLDEFLSIEYDSDKYGTQDSDYFYQLLREELFYFEQSISGAENMLNFKYSLEDNKTQTSESLRNVSLMKMAVRDSLKCGVIDGFLSNDLSPFENREISQLLIDASICFTHECSS